MYVDKNGQQCDGAMNDVMTIEPLADRLRAFGAEVHEVDGHDPDALAAPADQPCTAVRPLVVIAQTDPCRGIELLRQRAPKKKLHYVRFKNQEEVEQMQRLL